MKTKKTKNAGKVTRTQLKPVVLGGIAPSEDNGLETLTRGIGLQGSDDGDLWYLSEVTEISQDD
jgi:hypothetical protein